MKREPSELSRRWNSVFGPASPAQLSLALLVVLLIVLIAADGAHLLYTYWNLNRAVRETVRWATTYRPARGHHLSGLPCRPDEACHEESDEAYYARRAALIRAKARAAVRGEPLEEIAALPHFAAYAPGDSLEVKVWGLPDFTGQAVPNHPGLPGLPVRVEVSQRIEGLTPLSASLDPHLRLSAAAESINEGVHVGYGNLVPPSISTSETTANPRILSGSTGEQLIVTEAQIDLKVEDTDAALESTARMAREAQGYVVNQRVWYDGERQMGTIVVAVPAETFDGALEELREMAEQIFREEISGEDVTKEYYDLEGRLRNQELMRDRVRTLLEDAENVEEALEVSRELSVVEERIEELQGELEYLQNRIAFSTITVNVYPVVPPSSTAAAWFPREVVHGAVQTLMTILQALVNALIWAVIVLTPLFILLYLLICIGIRVREVRRLQRTPITEPTE